MNKLDDRGLVPYPGVGDYPLHMENSDKGVWDYAVLAERNALLELFETWINEDYRTSVDRLSLPTHLFQRIARLQDKTTALSG